MRWLLIVCAVASFACNNPEYNLAGPSAVIPPASGVLNVTGRWDGGISLTINGQRLSAPVVLKLEQSGSSVTGTWSALSVAHVDGGPGFLVGQDVQGEIRGGVTNSGTLSGTLTWDSARSDGGRCAGAGTVSGTTSGGQMQLSAPSLSMAGCTAPSALTWSVGLTYGTVR